MQKDKVVLIGSYYRVKFPCFRSVKVLFKEDPVDYVDSGLAYFFAYIYTWRFNYTRRIKFNLVYQIANHNNVLPSFVVSISLSIGVLFSNVSGDADSILTSLTVSVCAN